LRVAWQLANVPISCLRKGRFPLNYSIELIGKTF
jgi:hypothetical protein